MWARVAPTGSVSGEVSGGRAALVEAEDARWPGTGTPRRQGAKGAKIMKG